MTALAVIEHFDVFKDCPLGLFVRSKVLQRDAFGLECVKEALRDSVIPTVALATHAGLYPVPSEELAIAATGAGRVIETTSTRRRRKYRWAMAEANVTKVTPIKKGMSGGRAYNANPTPVLAGRTGAAVAEMECAGTLVEPT